MTKRLTDAEKQARYRARQNEKRNEDAGVATAGRSICYWLERAREHGVSNVAFSLGEPGKTMDFSAELARIEAAIAGAVIDAQQGKLLAQTGKGNAASKSVPASLSAPHSTRKARTRASKTRTPQAVA